MAEERLLVGGERGVALGADIDARREAQRADDAPRPSQRCFARVVRPGRREAVERVAARLEELRIGAVAAEAERELGDDGSAGEAREIGAEPRSGALDVEAAEGVEITSRLGVQLGRALGEEVEGTPEPA